MPVARPRGPGRHLVWPDGRSPNPAPLVNEALEDTFPSVARWVVAQVQSCQGAEAVEDTFRQCGQLVVRHLPTAWPDGCSPNPAPLLPLSLRLSLSLSLYVCLFMSLYSSIYTYLSISTSLSLYLSIYLSITIPKLMYSPSPCIA